MGSSGSFRLAEDIEAQHHFSNKPPRGYYESFYEQFTSYARVISNQARAGASTPMGGPPEESKNSATCKRA